MPPETLMLYRDPLARAAHPADADDTQPQSALTWDEEDEALAQSSDLVVIDLCDLEEFP